MKTDPSRQDMRHSALIAFDLMLAPMVVAMRLPLMAAEKRDGGFPGAETWRAIAEKNAALAEGVVAAQLSLMRSTTGFWFDVMAGRRPASADRVAGRAARAAMKPASRRVRANFKRLAAKS